MVSGKKINRWEESHERGENNTLYPQVEVVKFLNRYITKKLDYSGGRRELIEANKHNKIRCLDFGSGFGVHSMLCEEFGLEAYGVDISKIAINKAKFNAKTRGFDELSDRFIVLHPDEPKLPFEDDFFDLSIAESCLDSMYFEIAKDNYREIRRVTKRFVYFSLIGFDSLSKEEFENKDVVLSTKHEFKTIQSYYNLNRIKLLLEDDFHKLVYLVKTSNLSILDKKSNIECRFYGVIDFNC